MIHNIAKSGRDNIIKSIAKKVLQKIPISDDDCLYLYEKAETGDLAVIANYIRESYNNKNVYYNRNIHIEPTNICIYKCKFCSYSRKQGEQGSWEFTIEQMADKVKNESRKGITEVHIVGGVHPDKDIYYYINLIDAIRKAVPEIHIKAFSAVEIDYMVTKSNIDLIEGLKLLKKAGLDSIPGGGAEIFNSEIRQKICPEKTNSEQWLEIHKQAHLTGIKSNATMLYGHIESYAHRVEHLSMLIELQAETGGFMAFIPLKFKMMNNPLGNIGEVTLVEDLRNYAVSRIYMSNFKHIKAYWPMLGKEYAQMALSFGADDFDGTIEDSTKIYSMAGAKDQKPNLSISELKTIVNSAGFVAVERNSTYDML